jgi:ABC-type transport system involved in multi-copper enzyme maturation permease subunit
MRTTIRLLLKTYRFELIAITIVCLGLTGTELFLTTQLDALALPKECQFDQNISVIQGFAPQPTDQALADSCQAKVSAFYETDQHAAEIMGVGAAVPVLAGILIGVAVVGRELESGTVSLAWTLSRSRRRWYLTRALLVGAILGGVLLVPAFAANVLEHARQPLVDPGSSFADDGLRGPVIVLLGLLTYALAVVAGAIVGRQLPAVIVGLALAVAAILAFENAATHWEKSFAEWRSAASARYSIDIVLDQEYRDRATGAIVDQNTVFNAAPQTDNGPDSSWIDAHYDSIAFIVPGSRYGLIVAGESAAFGGTTLVFLGLGLLVVNRRRPD